MLINKKKKTIFLTIISLLLISVFVSAQGEVIELTFGQPPVSGSDTSRTLQSLLKVQGTGGLNQDALYLMTHVGDRGDIFQKENQNAIDHPWRNDTWRYCSIFSVTAGTSVLMGRNWDNQNVGSIIVSLYHPPKGYSSISFSRAIDMAYPLNLDLEQLKSSELGNKLLLAPFYATDGINEHGLAVAVSGVKETTHQPADDARLVFVTFLMRKILDQTKTIEEAVNLVETFVPFDLDRTSLNSHFLVADSSGRSVILEYDQDRWRTIYADKPYQVLTNKPISNVPDANLKEQCWRYQSISETLETTQGNVDWNAGLNILLDAAQQGTTWSVVYQWDVIYHVEGFSQ
jgi:hypothetical protein